jgi:ubiquinone/menaquinone biosynthesis C-methylase UbiE
MRRLDGARELIDGAVAPAARAATMLDMDRFSRWFRGYTLTLDELRRIAADVDPARPLTVIDVGGGGGHLAVRVVRWARQAGRTVRVIIVDRETDGLGAIATAFPEITRVRADATALPFREGGVHVAVTALTLHHLEPDAAVAALAEMRSAARRAVVVNDLLRNRLTLAVVWLGTRLLLCHRMSRHDGPLSVRRAYSPEELQALGEKAGLRRLVVHRHRLWGRLVAVAS